MEDQKETSRQQRKFIVRQSSRLQNRWDHFEIRQFIYYNHWNLNHNRSVYNWFRNIHKPKPALIAQRGATRIGMLTQIELSDNYLRFNIELIGVCNEQLDADRDPTYDEATDPTAPSNTKSQNDKGHIIR